MDGGAGRRRRPERRRATERGRWAHPQHLAERAEQPPSLRRGSEQFRHRGIGEQVLQLRGGGGGLWHPAHQPGEAARQAEGWGLGRARGSRAAPRRRQPAGADFVREAGEAERGAVQAPPEQGQQRPGEPVAGPARGDGAAQLPHHTGEAVGHGAGLGGGLHDSDTNMSRVGLGKGAVTWTVVLFEFRTWPLICDNVLLPTHRAGALSKRSFRGTQLFMGRLISRRRASSLALNC